MDCSCCRAGKTTACGDEPMTFQPVSDSCTRVEDPTRDYIKKLASLEKRQGGKGGVSLGDNSLKKNLDSSRLLSILQLR